MATDKQHKIPNAPNLRFPGFEGGWKVDKIQNLFTINVGGDIDKKDVVPKKDNDHPFAIVANALSNNGIYGYTSTFKDDAPSITVTGRGDVGYAIYREYPIYPIVRLLVLHSKGLLDCRFGQYAINIITIFNESTGVPQLTAPQLGTYRIAFPQIDEQKKISNFLSLIDARIQTQIGAIEKLQSLISTLNDKLQFQYCNEVNLSFSEIGNDYSGLLGKSANDFGRGKPYIPYTNVYANTFVDDNQFDLVKINEGEHQCRVSHGDVLFTLSSEVPEEVCVGSVYLGNEKELYLNSFCFGVHINSNKIHSPYLAYYVKSSLFRRTVYPLAQGSTRFNLQKSDFLKRKFSFPNIEHQIKIANILMAIDSKLKIEQKLLEQYKLQKQYLLSQMFV